MFGLDLYISENAGVPADQVRLLLSCLMMFFPLGQGFRKLPSPTAKYAASILGGMVFGYYCFGWGGVLHPLLVSTITYAVCMFAPQQAALIIWVFAFGYMSVAHIYRMYNDWGGWEMDFTTAHMIVTLKVIQLACNVTDSLKAEKDLHKMELADRTKLPPVLEYYGYVFYYASYLTGPCFTFNQYKAHIERKNTPQAFSSMLFKFGQALLVYVGVVISGMMPVATIATEEFLENPFFYRLGYVWISVVTYRFQYYFIWCLAEGSCISSGMAYNPDKDPKSVPSFWDKWGNKDAEGNWWDLTKAVDVTGVELAQNMKSVTDNWNCSVNRFLYVYVYQRSARPGTKVGQKNVMLTQFTSAMWHGFYPGYYLFFVSCSIVVNVARTARNTLRPVAVHNGPAAKMVYDALSWITCVLCLNVIGSSFILLDFWRGIAGWRSVYFFGHAICVLGMIVLPMLKGPLAKFSPPKEKKL